MLPSQRVLRADPRLVRRLQGLAGNQAVQRLIAGWSGKAKPKAPGQEDKLEEKEKEKGPPVLQTSLEVVTTRVEGREEGDAQPSLQGLVVQRGVAPNFVLTKPAPKRSNTDASTTSGEDPTFTGSASQKSSKKPWRYQLDSVEAKGKIQIVYFTEDRYPAPTPTDDSGALSNVKENNWKGIVKDLKENRAGLPDFWSAYRAEDLHEDYHWKNEWQKLVKSGIKKAESTIKKLKVSPADAAAKADAEKLLEPQAKTLFDAEMRATRTKWNAMGDDAGDPPFIAQAPAVDAVRSRVRKLAKEQKWK
jgi:hypothetical protein